MNTIAGTPATERSKSGGVAVSTGDGAGRSLTRPGPRWSPSTKRILVVSLLVLVGAVAGYLLLRPVPVTVADVTPRDIAPAIQGVGTVEAKVAVQVGSRITGRVVAVLADQGDTVAAGQVLARLDDAQQRAEVARREAGVRAADAAVAEAAANVRRTQSTLGDLVAGARPAELGQWQARVTSARATRVLAERDLRRTQELFAKELIAARDADRARQAFEVAAPRSGMLHRRSVWRSKGRGRTRSPPRARRSRQPATSSTGRGRRGARPTRVWPWPASSSRTSSFGAPSPGTW